MSVQPAPGLRDHHVPRTNFPYSEAGLRCQRSNSTTGIRFDMSGGTTIEVLWR
ncbi:hypothetical protein [Synechococcus sp. MIT S9508]|uniref:hypothetical protein n=1 Tax=Synechococcus sp. MIT S9508 TaxID=1801629 RepID=UPI000A7DFE5D|nr:hypothetical protein [Synechococcus sp. MIT S9508]